LFRRLAAGCIVSANLAWSSAMCYAAAFDSASDPAYNDGWQGIKHATNGTQISTGDNGGSGFTPWNFDAGYFWQGTLYAYDHPGFHAIDDGLKAGTHYSNPFNNIGRSWAIGGPSNSDGAAKYGRGFSPLLVGQTFSVTIDNPTKRQYYKGYTIGFVGNTGGVNGNICNGGHSCSPGGTGVNKLAWWRFDFNNYGVWQLTDNDGDIDTTLFDTDTAELGMRIELTRTDTNPDPGIDSGTYDLTVIPLANPGNAYTRSGTLDNPGTSLDWFQITFYNPPTDIGTPPIASDYNKNGYVDAADFVEWRKTAGSPAQLTDWRAHFGDAAMPTEATDFYIRSMSITNGTGTGLGQGAVPEPGTGTLLVFSGGTLLGCGAVRRRWH
jgi:hypothetical protein